MGPKSNVYMPIEKHIGITFDGNNNVSTSLYRYPYLYVA